MMQCKDKEDYSDDTFYGTKVIILGHRGMGEMYKLPGNTYESIAPVIAIGADGSEMDIQMTSDSALVLFYNGTLDANTTCTGRIYESTWGEIRQCKYYALQNNIFINSVDTLLSKLPEVDQLYFSFDCKLDSMAGDYAAYQDQFIRAIGRLCEKYNMTDHIFIEGGLPFLKRAQELGLKNKFFLGAALDEYSIGLIASNHFSGITVSMDYMNIDTDSAHTQGLYVMTWSPNNFSENKEALRKKADIIQTDDPISILKMLNRFNYEYQIP